LASGVATGSAKTLYIHPDHLGSTNVVTDASGTVAQTLDFYPYGATRISNGTGANEKRQFIGQFSDDSGLSYFQARYYDPTRGQFISQDPVFWSQEQNLRDPQSLNSYSYAEDNPITGKDPDGKSLTLVAAATILVSLLAVIASLQVLQASGVHSSTISVATRGVDNILNTVGTAVQKSIAAGTIGVISTFGLSPTATFQTVPQIGGIGGTAVTTPYAVTPSSAMLPGAQSQGISPINFATGKTTIDEKPGATAGDLQRDFDALNPTGVKDYPGGVKVGKLPNGDTVVARPTSTDGRPTLEIQRQNGDVTKTRYGTKSNR
jgi:RHS repeat-associated protein